MRILITGSTGFVGSKVLDILVKKKGLKIFATYKNTRPNNYKYKKVKWIKFDIFKLNNLSSLNKKFDILIHLLWPYLPDYENKKHLTKNLPVQKKFINFLIKLGVKNFFFSGTCYEYGRQSGKLSEKFKKIPNNSYAKSKYLFQKFIFKISKNKNLNITWGRIFYIFGYNKRRDTLYNLVLNKRKRSKVKIANNFYRDYLDVNVLANLIVILSMLKKNIGEVNLCSGFPISLKRLVKFFFKINRIKDNVSSEKKVSDLEANNFYGDNKKLKNILDKNLRKNEYKKIINSMIKHKKL